MNRWIDACIDVGRDLGWSVYDVYKIYIYAYRYRYINRDIDMHLYIYMDT